VLIGLAVVLFLLTLGLAFTSYGEIAALLAAVCLGFGVVLVTRDTPTR
jgi:hypothetical protein